MKLQKYEGSRLRLSTLLNKNLLFWNFGIEIYVHAAPHLKTLVNAVAALLSCDMPFLKIR